MDILATLGVRMASLIVDLPLSIEYPINVLHIRIYTYVLHLRILTVALNAPFLSRAGHVQTDRCTDRQTDGYQFASVSTSVRLSVCPF